MRCNQERKHLVLLLASQSCVALSVIPHSLSHTWLSLPCLALSVVPGSLGCISVVPGSLGCISVMPCSLTCTSLSHLHLTLSLAPHSLTCTSLFHLHLTLSLASQLCLTLSATPDISVIPHYLTCTLFSRLHLALSFVSVAPHPLSHAWLSQSCLTLSVVPGSLNHISVNSFHRFPPHLSNFGQKPSINH